MNYQYFGLFLNEHNRNELMKIIFANPIIANLVLQRGSTLYLDHCTLLHRNQNDKEIYDSLVKKIDESWMVEVNGIGFSNKAIAFRVTIPDLPCSHILLFAQSMEENQLIAMEYASGFLFPNSIFVVK